MNFIVRKKNSISALLTVLLVPLALMLIYSCSGSSSYDVSPGPGQTQVMVSSATLHNWVENGYGTDAMGITAENLVAQYGISREA